MKALYLAVVLLLASPVAVNANYYGPDLSSMMMTSFTYVNTANELTKDVYIKNKAKSNKKSSTKSTQAKSSTPKTTTANTNINPSQADVRRVANRLAKSWPSEHQAQMSQAFVSLYDTMRKDRHISKKLEGAIGHFATASYMAYSGNYVEDNIVSAVAKQYEEYVKENPNAFSGLSAEDKNDAYIEMIMLSAQLAFVTLNDPNNAGLKQAGERNLRQLFGVNPNRIKVSTSGISIQ